MGLRACPFCAHDRCDIVEISDDGAGGYTVRCAACRAHGPIKATLAAATREWNRSGDPQPGDDNDREMTH